MAAPAQLGETPLEFRHFGTEDELTVRHDLLDRAQQLILQPRVLRGQIHEWDADHGRHAVPTASAGEGVRRVKDAAPAAASHTATAKIARGSVTSTTPIALMIG